MELFAKDNITKSSSKPVNKKYIGKILIVDDASFVRIRLNNFLSGKGYQVVEAENGEVGVAKYKEESPSVVLMDITMPVMDGLIALREIIKFDKDAKIIMLTNVGHQKTIMEALKAGAKNFLLKPFEEQKILDALNKVIS